MAGSGKKLDGIGHPRLWIGRGKARFRKQKRKSADIGTSASCNPFRLSFSLLECGKGGKRSRFGWDRGVFMNCRRTCIVGLGDVQLLSICPFKLAHSCDVSKIYFGPDSTAD